MAVIAEIKHSYSEKEKPPTYFDEESHMLAEIQEQQSMLKTYEVTVKKFQAQIQGKDSELREATEKEENLEKTLRKKSFKDELGIRLMALLFDYSVVISTVEAATKAAQDFTKKTAEWDLDAASNYIDPGILYANRAHTKYAFESYVFQRMFSVFKNVSFYVTNFLPLISNPE